MEKSIKVIDGQRGEVAIKVRYPEGFAPLYAIGSKFGYINICAYNRSVSFSAKRDSGARFSVSVPVFMSQNQIEELIENDVFASALPHLCFSERMSHADAYDFISYITNAIFNGSLYSSDPYAAVSASDPRLP